MSISRLSQLPTGSYHKIEPVLADIPVPGSFPAALPFHFQVIDTLSMLLNLFLMVLAAGRQKSCHDSVPVKHPGVGEWEGRPERLQGEAPPNFLATNEC